MIVKIYTFASLKEFFDPEFSLEIKKDSNVESLLTQLSTVNPLSAHILNACRIAINEEFVSANYTINDGETICLIPPSSGG